MAGKKKKQHDSVGVSDELQDLLTDGVDTPDGEGEEENPFMLPEARKHAEPPCKTESKDVTESEKVEKDSEYARNNLYEIIETGMAAVQDLAILAREQMHPRTYEVLANLIKTTTENNLSLIELANSKKAAKKPDNNTPPEGTLPGPTTNNIEKAIFVGSSSELLKVLKQQQANNG